ncbi:1426_t:CDS:2 [Dentiscutata erythropus]|uniref:1426_t:CDS:1 n=1 Tax=Dentiscutata erythropus TaxID=1348616 RepID=A0A9N8WRR4_9GLOM|nr:1426_t:CDS:2 [Dentiscutata erythropus]
MVHLLYIFFRALIIFYCITVILVDCLGGSGYNAFYIENKLYFIGPYSSDHFYIDLKGVTLENGTISTTQWIFLAPSPIYIITDNPFIGGNSNKKLFFIDKRLPNESIFLTHSWITNKTTGISYSFQGLDTVVVIFDTINFAWISSNSTPQSLFSDYFDIYSCIPILLSNGQILYIGGNSSDGRVIVYGGESNYGEESNLSTSAIPYLAVLDTSKTPFEWSTPIEENSIGCLSGHTSVMVKNYMITAFGKNLSEKDELKSFANNIYKLDTSNLSNYKWSLLSNYDDQSIPVVYSNSSQTSPTPITTSFDSFDKTKLITRWIVTILVIVIAFAYFYVVTCQAHQDTEYDDQANPYLKN